MTKNMDKNTLGATPVVPKWTKDSAFVSIVAYQAFSPVEVRSDAKYPFDADTEDHW